ncbi:UNVERIFIED_CONTAM: hypothetical protein GTU68_009300 [Idotea baltica]|nr:hypothetical protein [Idotea baltica]
MVADIAAVMTDADLTKPHLVGHSLGGAVVSAAGAALDVATIVNVDQSLDLGGFKEQLGSIEPMLRDPASFPLVIAGLFDQMLGEKIDASERARLGALRQADQAVVLGVWNDILTNSTEEMNAIVDGALATFATSPCPYLALFGIDPGPQYEQWLTDRVQGACVELWPEHGHYPHLVDPDRFIARLQLFWGQSTI